MTGPPVEILLVDGHSVIFSWEDLRILHQENSRRAREELCHRLTAFRDQADVAVMVAFDGTGREMVTEKAPGGIQVFYSPKGGAADDIIERLVGKYAEQYRITVATGDRAEQMTVEGFGAETISPTQLRERLERADADFRWTARKFLRDD